MLFCVERQPQDDYECATVLRLFSCAAYGHVDKGGVYREESSAVDVFVAAKVQSVHINVNISTILINE